MIEDEEEEETVPHVYGKELNSVLTTVRIFPQQHTMENIRLNFKVVEEELSEEFDYKKQWKSITDLFDFEMYEHV